MCVLSFQVKGQLITSLSDETGIVGDTITLDVTVRDFENLLSFQFSINWDKDDLDFIEVGDPYISSTSFTYVSIDQGQIGAFWFDFGSGVSVPDGSTLFTISFKITGDPGDVIPVMFSGTPLTMEAIDATIQNVGVTGEDGSITIPSLISTQEISYPSLVRVYPNPFREETTLHFSCTEEQWVTLSLFDQNGRVINRKKEFFSVGRHSIYLGEESFPEKGIYTYIFEFGTLSRSGILMAY